MSENDEKGAVGVGVGPHKPTPPVASPFFWVSDPPSAWLPDQRPILEILRDLGKQGHGLDLGPPDRVLVSPRDLIVQRLGDGSRALALTTWTLWRTDRAGFWRVIQSWASRGGALADLARGAVSIATERGELCIEDLAAALGRWLEGEADAEAAAFELLASLPVETAFALAAQWQAGDAGGAVERLGKLVERLFARDAARSLPLLLDWHRADPATTSAGLESIAPSLRVSKGRAPTYYKNLARKLAALDATMGAESPRIRGAARRLRKQALQEFQHARDGARGGRGKPRG